MREEFGDTGYVNVCLDERVEESLVGDINFGDSKYIIDIRDDGDTRAWDKDSSAVARAYKERQLMLLLSERMETNTNQ